MSLRKSRWGKSKASEGSKVPDSNHQSKAVELENWAEITSDRRGSTASSSMTSDGETHPGNRATGTPQNPAQGDPSDTGFTALYFEDWTSVQDTSSDDDSLEAATELMPLPERRVLNSTAQSIVDLGVNVTALAEEKQSNATLGEHKDMAAPIRTQSETQGANPAHGNLPPQLSDEEKQRNELIQQVTDNLKKLLEIRTQMWSMVEGKHPLLPISGKIHNSLLGYSGHPTFGPSHSGDEAEKNESIKMYISNGLRIISHYQTPYFEPGMSDRLYALTDIALASNQEILDFNKLYKDHRELVDAHNGLVEILNPEARSQHQERNLVKTLR